MKRSYFLLLAAKRFECKIQADLGFIVDGSEDIDESMLLKEKEFVNAVVGSFSIRSDGARAGVVVGGDSSSLAVKMDAYADTSSFKAGIGRIDGAGGSMRIDKALVLAYDKLFSSSNGARDSVPQVLTIVTAASRLEKLDGNSLSSAASRFHETGIKLLVVVVGEKKGVNKDTLRKIAENAGDIFYVEKFDGLAATLLSESIAKAACKATGKCLEKMSLARRLS